MLPIAPEVAPPDSFQRTPEATSEAISPPASATPPDMLAETLKARPGSALTGEPTPLLRLLAGSSDRRRQSEVIQAYWRLAEAIGAYHACLDYQQELGRPFDAGATGGAAVRWRGARATAAALLRESEAAAVAAQYELASLAGWNSAASLPLPADRPHAGPYHTRFAEMYPLGNAPGRAAVLDRTIHLLAQSLDQRAAAVRAARDVAAPNRAGDLNGTVDVDDIL